MRRPTTHLGRWAASPFLGLNRRGRAPGQGGSTRRRRGRRGGFAGCRRQPRAVLRPRARCVPG
nr:MAG TPA: hypothetical protein [Caudoviricetes sp.]